MPEHIVCMQVRVVRIPLEDNKMCLWTGRKHLNPGMTHSTPTPFSPYPETQEWVLHRGSYRTYWVP